LLKEGNRDVVEGGESEDWLSVYPHSWANKRTRQ
jgi:hypothetical protein